MSFNSLEFLLFLPLVLLLYLAFRTRPTTRHLILLVASYLFYMSWYWHYAGLIALSTLVDFVIGQQMASSADRRVRRWLLMTSLAVNLGLLALFKYYNFFIDLTADTLVLSPFGIDLSFLHHELLLPVGISFYTFQTLSYTIDLYRKKIPPEPNLLRFALFVSFFPQLVAGPIVRAKDFLPQLYRAPVIGRREIEYGLALVFTGLFKKIVIADLLATLGVDAVFENPQAYSTFDLMFALYGYALQIYCDFSGYSDIAIGVALMLGFQLPTNFNRPYLAQNIREFWSRWHISLSTWLRDYLYIGLGGNRGSPAKTIRNLMLTMALGGLWHGAGLNFILWGLYHGLLLVLFHALFGGATKEVSGYRAVVNRLATFHLVLFGWLLFRIEDMEHFVAYLSGLTAGGMQTQLSLLYFTILALGAVLHVVPRRAWLTLVQSSRIPVYVTQGGYAGMLLLFWGASVHSPNFIYFQF